MSDVFISYSRKDRDFVHRLHDALVAQKRAAWVDWEDIPLTAEWWEEIKAGIEAADNFVFVISSESVRSKVCFDEIEHATQSHKRIVPILHHEIADEADQQRVHPAINRHNWVFIRDTDPFDEAFQALIAAIDTDLDHVRTHTRLLVRARNWDATGRESGPLLRGSDLAEAEVWLAVAGSKGPKPTPLHTEYILASRRATNRVQRSILASVSIALAVTICLLGLTYIFFRQAIQNLDYARQRGTEAVEQAETAVYEEGRARSIALAVQAQLELEGPVPERGVLLALEAVENYPYTWQAEWALWIAVRHRPVRVIVEGNTRGAWLPDDPPFATARADGIAKIWRAWQTTDDLIAYARECCVVRELTPEERAQFNLPPR
jgi:hypothetical protein